MSGCVVFGLKAFGVFFMVQRPALYLVAVSLRLQWRFQETCRDEGSLTNRSKLFFLGGGLKETGAPTERLRQRVNTGAAAI